MLVFTIIPSDAFACRTKLAKSCSKNANAKCQSLDKLNLSDYLVQHLYQDYNTLSHLFTKVENRTIEKFYINQRVERVKELLTYNELTLSEIAIRQNYSSVGHLAINLKRLLDTRPVLLKN